MIKYIIFDFDDTLSNFQKCKDNSKVIITPYLRENGVNIDEYWEEYEAQFEVLFSRYVNHELGVHEYRIMRFLHHGITKEQAELFNEIYLETVHKPLLFDDVIPVLKELKSRGYKLYILSNGPESQRNKIISCEASNYFDSIFISAELDCGKPSKEVYEKVLSSINAKPEECIMIGDSYENDCAAAERAGIYAVQVNRNNKKIKNYKNQIDSLYQIFEYLDKGEQK